MTQSPQLSHFREVIEMENLCEDPCHCRISSDNLILWSIINRNLMWTGFLALQYFWKYLKRCRSLYKKVGTVLGLYICTFDALPPSLSTSVSKNVIPGKNHFKLIQFVSKQPKLHPSQGPLNHITAPVKLLMGHKTSRSRFRWSHILNILIKSGSKMTLWISFNPVFKLGHMYFGCRFHVLSFYELPFNHVLWSIHIKFWKISLRW